MQIELTDDELRIVQTALMTRRDTLEQRAYRTDSARDAAEWQAAANKVRALFDRITNQRHRDGRKVR